MDFQERDLGIKIYFRCEEMDLRDISIVSAGIHSAINSGLAQGLSLDRMFGSTRHRYWEDKDLLIASLVVTDLRYGPFSAETKLKLNRVLRDVSIGVASSLIASTLGAIGDASSRFADLEVVNSKVDHAPGPIDIGDNVHDMASRLSETGKEWEIVIEDPRSGARVHIRSRR